MTQIQHVTEKEMTRRTGVKNALGYTYPEKDLILLKKGLTGKKKREVLEHEINHLKKGEEGPWVAEAIGAGASILGAREGRKGAEAAAELTRKQLEQAAGYYQPYRRFGKEQLGELQNWLAGPGGAFAEITPEEVMGTPGYETRLRGLESSAAARGGLLSGNLLRRVGEEFIPSEIESERRRRQSELAQRLGLVGVGERAAGGSAGIAQTGASLLPQISLQGTQAAMAPYSDIAGFAGQYGARQDFRNMLSQYAPVRGDAPVQGDAYMPARR